jgi:hypothetical protein
MCYYCGEAVPRERKVGFGETCAACGKDMHVCIMCVFYLRGAHWDCRESVDALVADKEKRNFCEWFELNPKFFEKFEGAKTGKSAAETAKSAFDSLFGA